MYRTPPDHALYQGDVIVAPILRMKDATIPVLRDSPVVVRCVECQAEHALSDLGPCPKCGQTMAARAKRPRAAIARRKDGERPFESDAGTELVVASVEVVGALIVSHSCDIDTKEQIRLVPVRPLEDRRFNASRESIRVRVGHHAFFYLPQTVRLPEAAACLNEAFHLPAQFLGERRQFFSPEQGRNQKALAPYVEVMKSRRASLDGDGLEALYEALIRFEIRPKEMKLAYQPAEDLFHDDPARPQRDELPVLGWDWPPPLWLRI